MNDALKKVAVLAGVLFLKEKLTQGGVLSGLGDMVSDFFGTGDGLDAGGVDMTSYPPSDVNVPFVPGMPFYNQYGGGYPFQPSPYVPVSQNPYYYPISSYGGPGSTVFPRYPAPYGGTGGAVYGQPYAGYPGGSYPTPATTYPPVWSNIFGSGQPTQPMSDAEAALDALVKYGIQAGLLQSAGCSYQAMIPGQSQYHNCFFTWTTARGKQRTGNFKAAAAVIKAYQRTGRLN